MRADPVAAVEKLGPGADVAAVRMRDELADELAFSPGMSEHRKAALNEAMDELEQRFPVLADIPVGQAEEHAEARRSTRGYQGVSKPERKTSTATPNSKTSAAAAVPSRSKRSRAGTAAAGGRRRASSSRRAGGRRQTSPGARRAIEQTGIPSATRNASQIAMQAIGISIGLSVLYLLLTSSERSRNAPVLAIAHGVTTGVRRFVAPVDPLARVGGTPAPAPSSTATGAAAATTGAAIGAAARRHPTHATTNEPRR